MLDSTIQAINCERIAEIVPYIYGESAAVERERFELHIVDCGICTDELAAIAEARFSVYEWNQVEFASIPTPNFVIPYDNPVIASEGLIARLKKTFSVPRFPVWQTAAAAFGTIAVLIGIGVFAFSGLNNGNSEIAANTKRIVSPDAAVSARSPAPDETPSAAKDIAVVPAKRAVSAETAVKVSGSQISRQSAHVTRVTNNPTVTVQAKLVRSYRPESRPTLSGNDDDADDSLRLSDLFSEVDSIE